MEFYIMKAVVQQPCRQGGNYSRQNAHVQAGPAAQGGDAGYNYIADGSGKPGDTGIIGQADGQAHGKDQADIVDDQLAGGFQGLCHGRNGNDIAQGQEQGRGAVSLRGKMIDKPIVDRARRVLDQARALGLGGDL